MASRIRRPAGRGQGATVLSPRPASRARARGTDVFIATSIKANAFPDRLRRCEPRRRPKLFSNAARAPMVGDTNCFFGMPCLPGCPALRSQLSHRRSAGTPRRYRAACFRTCTRNQGRHALGRRRGSPRLAGPGREQLFPHRRLFQVVVTRMRGRTSPCRPRLHAAPSARSSIGVRRFGAVRQGLFA